MNNRLEMTKEDVLNYISKNNLTIELLDNTEPAMEGLYQLTSNAGHSTFEMRMTEDKAKYASVLLYRLHLEHNVPYGPAERLAMAYVSTFKVMQDDTKQEATEEERQAVLAALDNTIETMKEGLA
tara:strand:+ start:426 stop:800 length:375 start_codon:yes stop_codon:yes gene_type:complete